MFGYIYFLTFFKKIKNVFRVCILKDVPQVSCLIVLSADMFKVVTI